MPPRTPTPGNSLADQHPTLAAEWHPTLNGNLRAHDVSPGSQRKVSWLCSAGHAYEMAAEKRTKDRPQGCPFCAGRRPVVGVSDLASQHPSLAAEWHPALNEGLEPAEVTSGSSRTVWWTCLDGHEWQAKIVNRARLGSGCPYCAGQRPIRGETDLATTHPHLATQWAHNLNGDTTPQDVMGGSNKKRWWRCHLGHEWEASPNTRTSKGGQGCAVCSGKRVLAGFNDLATVSPDVASQWHPQRNVDLAPTQVTVGSSRAVWWLCPKGHEWKTTVARRRQTGCPVCSGRVADQGVNDLATLHPDVVAELWAHDLNQSPPSAYKPSSAQDVWWRCAKGHTWMNPVHIHGRLGLGCPVCSGHRLLGGVNDLASQHPEIAAEWHEVRNAPLLPAEVQATSHKIVWWLCPLGHEWSTEVRARTLDNVICHACSGRTVIPGFNDLATTHPSVAREWRSSDDGSNPESVLAGSNRSATWECTRGHQWVTTYAHRTLSESGCPSCSLSGVSKQEIRIAAEINAVFPLQPGTVSVVCADRAYRVDMLSRDGSVVIEFDGVYWHSLDGSRQKDVRKTSALTDAGLRVIRIREPGLDPITEDDVVATGQDPHAAAVAVLQRLHEWGEVSGQDLADYAARGRVVAAAEADANINERWGRLP